MLFIALTTGPIYSMDNMNNLQYFGGGIVTGAVILMAGQTAASKNPRVKVCAKAALFAAPTVLVPAGIGISIASLLPFPAGPLVSGVAGLITLAGLEKPYQDSIHETANADNPTFELLDARKADASLAYWATAGLSVIGALCYLNK